MQLYNTTPTAKYSSITSVRTLPGRRSRDISTVKDFLKSLNTGKCGMMVILDDEEVKGLKDLIAESKKALKITPESVEGYDDPYGLKKLAEYRARKEEEAEKARSEKIEKERKEQEAFDNLGRPGGKKQGVSYEEAELLSGAPVSLSQLKRHNSAIESMGPSI